MRNRTLLLAAVVALASLGLGGCAAMQKSDNASTEQELAAAGFTMKMANTEQKLAHLKTMTQRKVVPHDQNGTVRYVYADAKYCKCVYAGDQTAYGKYQKMVVDQRIAMQNEAAAMNWGMWGPGFGW